MHYQIPRDLVPKLFDEEDIEAAEDYLHQYQDELCRNARIRENTSYSSGDSYDLFEDDSWRYGRWKSMFGVLYGKDWDTRMSRPLYLKETFGLISPMSPLIRQAPDVLPITVPDRFTMILDVITQDFLEAPKWQSFRDTFNSATCLSGVTNIVCLGLSSIFNATDARNTHTFMHELALVLASKRLIEQHRPESSDPIDIVFQDPCFTNADAWLLTTMGHKVVRNHHAVLYIKPTSLVFGSHLPWHAIWDLNLRYSDPAMYIGNSIRWATRRAMAEEWLDQEEEEMWEIANLEEVFLSKRVEKKFTNMNTEFHEGFFNDQYIYWKKHLPVAAMALKKKDSFMEE